MEYGSYRVSMDCPAMLPQLNTTLVIGLINYKGLAYFG